VDIRATTALRVTAIVFGVLIALRFLWIAHAIFFVTFFGVLIGLALSRAADWLEEHRVRRAIGAPATLIACLALVIAIGTTIAPSITGQAGEIVRDLPKAMQSIERRLVHDEQGQLGVLIARELRGMTHMLFPVISSVLGAIGGAIIILFIAMYIAVEPDIYRTGILHLVPHRERRRAEEVLDTLRDTLRQWLVARLLAMIAIGLITGLGLTAMRVKGAAALGILAGVLEIIPFFGPIASAIPAVTIALTDSPQKALAVLLLYTVIQQLEGHLITPLILERRLDVPPVLTIVSVAAMGIVFGVLGMLVAEPILAATLVVTKMLYVQDVVHDDVAVGS
jgi:predicted PurR-regulated permease PerM